MAQPDKPTPHIDIIFLGSPGVGKATFISRLPHVQHPSVTRRERLDAAPSAQRTSRPDTSSARDEAAAIKPTPSNDSQATLIAPAATSSLRSSNDPNDSQATLVAPPSPLPTPPPPPPPPPPTPCLEQPQTFHVQLFSRPYSVTIHASSSPIFIDPFPPNPHLLILTFSIPDRASLFNVQHYWMPQYHMHYPTSTIPILLLGLKRDLRTGRKRAAVDPKTGRETGREEYECVIPEEGLQAAREMRVDRYAECSAQTGELMWEATQDITKMAAGTTVDSGDYASEMCVVM